MKNHTNNYCEHQCDTKENTCCLCSDTRTDQIYTRFENGHLIAINRWESYCDLCINYFESNFPLNDHLYCIYNLLSSGFTLLSIIESTSRLSFSYTELKFPFNEVFDLEMEKYEYQGVGSAEEFRCERYVRNRILEETERLSKESGNMNVYFGEQRKRMKEFRRFNMVKKEVFVKEERVILKNEELKRINYLGVTLNRQNLKKRERKKRRAMLRYEIGEERKVREGRVLVQGCQGCDDLVVQYFAVPCGHLVCAHCSVNTICAICHMKTSEFISL